MELSTSKVVRVSQKEIEEAILGLIFKKKPELRPSGMDGSESPPQIHFTTDKAIKSADIMAIVTLENVTEEVVKP